MIIWEQNEQQNISMCQLIGEHQCIAMRSSALLLKNYICLLVWSYNPGIIWDPDSGSLLFCWMHGIDVQCKIKRILFRSIISPPIYLGKLEKRADISPASRHVIAEVHTSDQKLKVHICPLWKPVSTWALTWSRFCPLQATLRFKLGSNCSSQWSWWL